MFDIGLLEFAATPPTQKRLGCKHTDGEYHDCEYVDARNKLIPKAWVEAKKQEGDGANFGRAFADTMVRLAKETGLT